MDLRSYAEAWVDMAPHVDALIEYGRTSERILELGVRGGVSTWAFLDGLRPTGRLLSVDIDPSVERQVPARVRDDQRWKLWIADSTTLNHLDVRMRLGGPADTVLIDTSHTYDDTLAELYLARSVGAAVILCHDVNDPAYPGVKQAITVFTSVTASYKLVAIHDSPWGLAALA